MLDLPITKDVSIDAPTLVSSTTTRVNGVLFDLDNTKAFASISFCSGSENDLTVLSEETWILSGAYYAGMILTVTTGKTIAEELLTVISTVVMQLQGNDALKASLISSGEMHVVPGNICSFFNSLDPT